MASLLRTSQKIHFKRTFFTTNKSSGYIVLLPEIGEDAPDKNPLYQSDGLPEFNNVTIENCRAAIARQTLDFEKGIKQIEESLSQSECQDIFKGVFQPLEKLGQSLEFTWGVSKTLYLGNSTLMPTSSYMAIHDRARQARIAKFNSSPIFNAVKAEIEAKKDRSTEENRVLRKFMIEGKLNGMDLDHSKKENLSHVLKTVAHHKEIFKNKMETATKQFYQPIRDRVTANDFPDDLKRATAIDPNFPDNGPWKLTLQPHIYMSAMEYCANREIRWNLWQGFVSRGSLHRDRELTTSVNLETIRQARGDIAKNLGYETYADMSMETKMAGSVDEVYNMLNFLQKSAKPAQQEELQNLLQFAQERGFKSDTLEPWDIPYWRRKQLRSQYDYDEKEIKEYFPLPTVLEGMFQLCEKLFSVVIKQRTNVTAWHKDVKYYDIFESHSSSPIAGFYLDPYVRSQEKIKIDSKGWMVGIQNRSEISNTKPLAALIFNFDPPVADKPSQLSFREVKSLFNRFGHALQHLLTRTTYSEVAGLSNVEWDAVDISGNMLLHWLQNKEVVQSISCHCDSEDKIPDRLLNALQESHRHLAALDLCKELYLSALDLELHISKDFWLEIVKRLWPQYHDITLHKIDQHPCSFTQIFVNEWAAAYYSHVWSRVIAADVYSAFYEVQDNEQSVKDVGKRYRDTFLALGGSEHPSQIFREFRGRDPSAKALLKSLGIKKSKEDN